MFRRAKLYQPDMKQPPAEAAVMFDVIVTAMGDEREKYLRDMQAAGWTGEAWLYLTQHSVEVARTGKVPNRNQVAYKPGDYATLSEEWFAHNPDGSRVLKNAAKNYAMMDFKQPGWRDFFLLRTKEIIERNPDLWKVVLADDVSPRFFVNEIGVVNTSTYGDMTNALDRQRYLYNQRGYLRHLGARLSEFCPLGGNLQSDTLDAYATLLEPLAAGVVMNEHQFLDASGNYQSVNQWKLDVDKTEAGVRAGARVLNVAQLDSAKIAAGDAVTLKKLNYWLASHALTADENSLVAFAPYSTAYPVPLDDVRKLGEALEPYTILNGVYTRKFTGGWVWVDPESHDCNLTFFDNTPQPQPVPDYVTVESYNTLRNDLAKLLTVRETKTPGV